MGCGETFENHRTELAILRNVDPSRVSDLDVLHNFIDGIKSSDGFYRL